MKYKQENIKCTILQASQKTSKDVSVKPGGLPQMSNIMEEV